VTDRSDPGAAVRRLSALARRKSGLRGVTLALDPGDQRAADVKEPAQVKSELASTLEVVYEGVAGIAENLKVLKLFRSDPLVGLVVELEALAFAT
jgi:hypothetical protein